jgi:hypothetical protein
MIAIIRHEFFRHSLTSGNSSRNGNEFGCNRHENRRIGLGLSP